MEKISITDLQNLANIIAEEHSISLKSKMQAWVDSKATNHEHQSLSGLFYLADQSSVRNEIYKWSDEVFKPIKIEEDAIQKPSAKSVSLQSTSSDSGEVEQGIPEPKEPTKKSKAAGKKV